MTIDQTMTLLGLILTFFGGIIIALITSGYFKQQQKEKRESDLVCTKDLELCNDSVFIDLDNLLRDVNNHLHMENKGKEKVLKCIMNEKIPAYRDNLFDLCLEVDKKIREGIEITEEDLFKLNIDMFEKSFKQYTEFYINNDSYKTEDKKVLSKVMEKFNVWNAGTIKAIYENIKNTCFSKYVKDIRMKQAMINSHYRSAFSSTVIDIENTADQINGSLDGLKFKDVTL